MVKRKTAWLAGLLPNYDVNDDMLKRKEIKRLTG